MSYTEIIETALNFNDLRNDIRAEALAADLIEQKVAGDDIMINPLGIKERKFRKDIVSVKADENPVSKEEIIMINVSREGLYDGLPQGLFHKSDSTARSKGGNVDLMIEESRRLKEEEEEARRFFRIFEKEFNRSRVTIELEERKSILGISENFRNELFLKVWNDMDDINPVYLPGLFNMLPYMPSIVGNQPLTESCFSSILKEHVSIKIQRQAGFADNDANTNVLGERYAGIDFIIGNSFPDYSDRIDVIIGPIPKDNLIDYLAGGKAQRVLEVLCDYLFPFDCNVNTIINLKKEENIFTLSENQNEARLGYTSIL